MNYTENFKFNKPERNELYDVDVFNENMDKVDEALRERPPASGDASDMTVGFTEASATAELTSGEKLSTAFGKIAKAVKDFVSHITTKATTSVLGHVKVTDSSAVTDTTGLALAATEKNAAIGGTLANQISQVNSDLGKMLPLKGGKMSGGIEMNGNTIGSVGDIFLNDKNAFLNALLTNMNIEIKKKRDSFPWLNPVSDLNDFYNGVALFNENASNRPTQDWYMVLSAGDANTRTQVAVSLYSGVIYTRYCSASNWSGWSDKFALKSDLDITSIACAPNSAYVYLESENSESYISVRKSGKIAIANINVCLKAALTAGTEYALAPLSVNALYAARSTANCGEKVADLKIYSNNPNHIIIIPKENLSVGQFIRGQIMFFV